MSCSFRDCVISLKTKPLATARNANSLQTCCKLLHLCRSSAMSVCRFFVGRCKPASPTPDDMSDDPALRMALLQAELETLRAHSFARDEEFTSLQTSYAGLETSNLDLQTRNEELRAEVKLLKAPEEGLGGTPWCLNDEEMPLRATNAWLPVVSFSSEASTGDVFTPVKEVDGVVWVARGWPLGTTTWGWEEEEWVPYQAPSADEVALVTRDARVLAYEVENGYDNTTRALRPVTNMAVAGRFLRAALREPSYQGPLFYAAEAELKELQNTFRQHKEDQAAARHATNRHMQEAGMGDRLPRHVEAEEEEEFGAQRDPVLNKKKNNNIWSEAERWCHDGFEKLWGKRSNMIAGADGSCASEWSESKFRSKSKAMSNF